MATAASTGAPSPTRTGSCSGTIRPATTLCGGPSSDAALPDASLSLRLAAGLLIKYERRIFLERPRLGPQNIQAASTSGVADSGTSAAGTSTLATKASKSRLTLIPRSSASIRALSFDARSINKLSFTGSWRRRGRGIYLFYTDNRQHMASLRPRYAKFYKSCRIFLKNFRTTREAQKFARKRPRKPGRRGLFPEHTRRSHSKRHRP